MSEFVVYMATCLVTGRRYVGLTRDFKKRKLRHLLLSKRGSCAMPKFYPALRKYGEAAFEWQILQQVKDGSRAALGEAEVFWIAKYDSWKSGYNCTPGGYGVHGVGVKHTPESNRKRAEALRGVPRPQDVRDRISAAHRGKRKSDAHRENIAAALLARARTPEAVEARALRQEARKLSRRIQVKKVRKGEKRSLETRQNMSQAHLGKKLSHETRRKMSLAAQGRVRSPETRARMSAAARERMSRPGALERLQAARWSSPEKIQNVLERT